MIEQSRQTGGLLLRIAERALNRPLLIHPDKIPLILGVLEGRIPLGDVSGWREQAERNIDALPAEAQAVMRGPQASRFVGDTVERDPASGKAVARLPYQRTANGTAVITVTGSLINRGAFVGSYSGETSYEGIKFQLTTALADPKVSSILLDIESPGGEAVGAMEAAAAVRAADAQKPVFASVNGMAASAAYALASGARRIVTAPTGVNGSIGVVMLHADYSRQLDKAGITPTLIFAGAHKVDGNALEPLSPSVKEDLQREVNQFYDLFVQTVAAGRKTMSPAAIRGTEARVFIGEEAVRAGLADAVGTFEDVLTEITASTARSRASATGATMKFFSAAPAADKPGETVEVVTKAEADTAIAAARAEGQTVGKAEGIKEGTAAGAKAANDRITAVLGSDKVKGKTETALKLTLSQPDLSAEQVIDIVASLPAGSAAATIEQRMQGQGIALALGGPLRSPQAASDGWDQAVANVNSTYGIAPKK